MKRKNLYKISRFVGIDCGTIIPLPRVSRQREKGHIKDIWCPMCGKTHGFREYKQNEFYMNMCGEMVENVKNMKNAG